MSSPLQPAQAAVCSPSPLFFSGIADRGWNSRRTPPFPNLPCPPPSTRCLILCFISTKSLPFCPLSTGMVWCVGSPPSRACPQADLNLPNTYHPPPRTHLSHLFSTFFTFPSFSVCLSTHLSSQRILHWSNECANSACCIKCGHPNKLHPLQGIGSEVILESPPGARLHRFTCSCQSPKPITTPEVDVLISRAVFLQQHNPKFTSKVAL